MKKLYSTLFLFIITTFSYSQTQLTVRGYSEGFYRASTGTMVAVVDPVNHPFVCDTALIELIDSATMQSAFCSYELVSTDGYGSCAVPNVLTGNYFVSMKFRNTFHIISKHAMTISGFSLSVDLTIPQNVCCNFDTTHGVAKAFSGDVNNDGAIDGSDFLEMDPDIQSHVTGYVITDLTGDNVVDILDFNILDNHINSGLSDDYLLGCSLVGILENDLNTVNVFPNPCTDHFTISLDRTYTNIRIQLFDVLGKKHLDQNYKAESMLRINTEVWQSGIYFIRVTADGMGVKQGVVIRN